MSLTTRGHSHLPPSPSRSKEKGAPSSSLATKPSATSSTLLTKPSTSLSRNNIRNSNIRPISTTSLGATTSSDLHFKPGRSLVPIRSNNTKETASVQFERSKNKYDGREIILPEDEPNISIDKLLAQWEDKINRAENEFEEEELAFERAQARLSIPNHTNSRRSLSPDKSTRVLEKAKRIIGQNDRLSPIKKHHNPL